VHVVDERERAHLLELVAQREDQQQRELREVATEPLTSHSTTSSVRCGRLGRWWVVSGRRRWRSRPGPYAGSRAAAAPGVVLLGQPGRQPAGQRVDLAAHLLEVGLARR
jgi:hypothetical protein